jgi:predicted porin
VNSTWTTTFFAAALLPPALSAFAQSGVEMDGAIALGVRVVTHAGLHGSATRVGIDPTPNGAGRWAIRGREDLGDGWRFHFNLDTAFFPDTGAPVVPEILFAREASVGLTTPVGRFDAGRLQVTGSASEPLAFSDPLQGGSIYGETTWLGWYAGVRFDNALRWRAFVGPALLGAMFASGEQAQGRWRGSTAALTAGVAIGDAKVIAALQENRDGDDHRLKTFSIGGLHDVGAVRLHAAYIHQRRDAGFTVGALPGMPLWATQLSLFPGLPAPADSTLDGGLVGVTWRATPVVAVKAAVHYARSGKSTLVSMEPGTQRVAYLAVDYALSRRTFLEAEIDHNRWGGGWRGFFGSGVESGIAPVFDDGRDTRTTVTVGMRHEF